MAEEKSIEQLQKELEDSQTALTEANKKAEDAGAENELLAEENASLKKQIELLMKSPKEQQAASKMDGVGDVFEYDGAEYKLLTAAMRIPGLGKRTALEILVDDAAKEWLVKNNSGMIKKMA